MQLLRYRRSVRYIRIQVRQGKMKVLILEMLCFYGHGLEWKDSIMGGRQR